MLRLIDNILTKGEGVISRKASKFFNVSTVRILNTTHSNESAALQRSVSRSKKEFGITLLVSVVTVAMSLLSVRSNEECSCLALFIGAFDDAGGRRQSYKICK